MCRGGGQTLDGLRLRYAPTTSVDTATRGAGSIRRSRIARPRGRRLRHAALHDPYRSPPRAHAGRRCAGRCRAGACVCPVAAGHGQRRSAQPLPGAVGPTLSPSSTPLSRSRRAGYGAAASEVDASGGVCHPLCWSQLMNEPVHRVAGDDAPVRGRDATSSTVHDHENNG
jgi:hypothetical protein